jgi:uncharacterized protein
VALLSFGVGFQQYGGAHMLLKFPLDRLDGAPFEDGAPLESRLLAGHPKFRTWTFEEAPDSKLFAGVWESTPGKWRIVYDEWEYCSIISGVSIVTRDGEAPTHFGAGDAFVIQPGFEGTWEVVETTRKLFVVRLG